MAQKRNSIETWKCKEYDKGKLCLAEAGNSKDNTEDMFFGGERWNSKMAFHYFNDEKKMPLVVASYLFDNPLEMDNNGQGYFIYFFNPNGKGNLIRGHYIGFSGPRWDTSQYKISTGDLPEKIKKKFLELPNEETKLIRDLFENSEGLSKDKLLKKFRKDKSLIEQYAEGSIFYEEAQKNVEKNESPLSLNSPNPDSKFFNKKLCQEVGMTLEKILD